MMENNALRKAIMSEALAKGGFLQLDFSNPVHYEYYMSGYGGEERVKRISPDFYRVVQRTRLDADAAGALNQNEYGLENKAWVSDYVSIKKVGNSCVDAGFNWSLSTGFVAAYANKPMNVAGSYEFYDEDRQVFIGGDSGVLAEFSKEENAFVISANSMTFSGSDSLRGRHLSASAKFEAIQACADGSGDLAINAIYCVEDYIVRSTNQDIESIVLTHPNTDKTRTGDYKDCVCIAYNRQYHMQGPDYIYDESMLGGVKDIPVHLPIVMTITLRNDATFEDINDSYLSDGYDPVISLHRFKSETGEVIDGVADLQEVWYEISRKYIKVEDNGKKLTLALNTNPGGQADFKWRSRLVSDSVMNTYTRAGLMGKISFNTRNKLGSAFAKQTTTIYFKDKADNSNEVAVKTIYYQWGCIAADSQVLLETGTKRADEIALGDRLRCRGGKLLTVSNCQTGPETQMLRVSAGGRSVTLSHDHTLNTAQGPRAAADVYPGDMIELWDADAGTAYLAEVTEAKSVEYQGVVYNFEFEESEFFVADGILVGDIPMQQSVRPMPKVTRAPVNYDKKLLQRLQAQMKAMTGTRGYPEFVISKQPECLAVHYFTVKALAAMCGLSGDQAQLVAEICQFVGDNATTGGLRVKNEIPAWLNKAGWFRGAPDAPGEYDVLIVPTAMVNWYKKEELDKDKQWFPDETPGSGTRYHNVQKDILRPFHFFDTLKNDVDPIYQVVYNSDYLRSKLVDLENRFKPHHTKMETVPRELLIELGVALHVLLDTMLHDRFSGRRSRINLACLQAAYDPAGYNITDKFPAEEEFRSYTPEDYSEKMAFPAGLQRISRVMDKTYAGVKSYYPEPGEIGASYFKMEPNQWCTFNQPLEALYSQRVVAAINCIRRCLGHSEMGSRDWSDHEMRGRLQELYKVIAEETGTKTEFDVLKDAWSEKFDDITFDYSAAQVYTRMMEGDAKKTESNERYGEFYEFSHALLKFRRYVEGGDK